MDRSIDTRESERQHEPTARPERLAETNDLLRIRIDSALQQQPSFAQFVERLNDAGVTVIPSIQKSGRLNGLSFVADGQRVRGSDLGRSYTACALEKRGLSYDSDRDAARARELAQQGEKQFPQRNINDRQDSRRDARERAYDELGPSLRAAMKEIGRFRTILQGDFERLHYRGDQATCRRELREMIQKSLVEKRSVVITTHAKRERPVTRSLSVLVLTRRGRDLLKRSDPDLRVTRQALYAGFVKPREIAHDTAIYRMYQAEAAHIANQGATVKRVILDFELKKKAYSPLAKARAVSLAEFHRKQEQVAADLGLKVIAGKIRLPDLRIEYETATGEAGRVDLELATEHYRVDHMSTKSQAGFKIYAEQASFPPGGSSGGSPVFDDHHIDIFSF